jgi:hypothetical protein
VRLILLLLLCAIALSLLPPGEGEPGWDGWEDGRCEDGKCEVVW